MMASSEPPYIPIGTDVSAKYKGAFCEAKVKKIVKSVKCRVFLKETQSSLLVTDEFITGPLKLGGTVEVKHPETSRVMEAVIKQMNDSSMYTVVFDDADERTLRRTQLCLKGDKHFMESETLDNLPLSNPEHFGTPVIAKGKRGRSNPDDESGEESDETTDEEGSPRRKVYRGKNQDMVGKVMFYESGDRKKSQTIPVLVILPDAHPMELKTKDHLLVRSFKDSKYLSALKKDLTTFTREAVIKNEDKTLKPAMEKALLFIDNRELPPSWNKSELIGSDDDEDETAESSDDDEPSEEKDRFVAQLYKFSDDRGTPINKGPSIGSKDLNLYKLFKVVQKLGGYNRVTNQMKWRLVYSKMALPPSNTASTQIKNAYKKYLHAFEDFYRKLGSSMGTISRPVRNQGDSGRSILSFRGRESGKSTEKVESEKEKEKPAEDAKSEMDSDAEIPKPGTPKRPKSARIKLDMKGDQKEQKEDKKEEESKVESKKEDKKETKKEEVANKKNASKKVEPVQKKTDGSQKKVEKKEEVKQETEKKSVRKKDEATPKTKKETNEEKELKDLQKKIVRRRSMRNDDKAEEEETEEPKKEKEEPKKDKKEETKEKKKDEKEEDKKKDDDVEEKVEKAEKKTKKKKTPAKKIGESDDEGRDEGTPPPPVLSSNTHDLPVGSKLKIRYGRGRNSSVYEAKVLEVGSDSGPKSYLVHYQGWNNRHDEWVKPERIVKVLERPDSKKKGPQKPSPKPGPINKKKKASLDKPPASPSSVKSDSSQGRASKAGRSPHTSSPAATAGAPGKIRPTRSNSIDVKVVDSLPVKRRSRKTSSTYDSVNGSDSDLSDKSEDESEAEKKVDKALLETPAKTSPMPAIFNQKEEAEMDTSVERSPPQLSKVTDISKKMDTEELEEKAMDVGDKSDEDKLKEEPVAPVLNVMQIEKNSEPILEKMEAQLHAETAKITAAAEVKEKEVKKRETEKRGRKQPVKPVEVEEVVKKYEKVVEPEPMDTSEKANETKEESPYDFKDEPDVDSEMKVRERRKPLVVLQETKEKESEEKGEGKEEQNTEEQQVVKESVDAPEVVPEKALVVDKNIASVIAVSEEKETAKSDSEVEKIERRGSRKKKPFNKEESKEVKKTKAAAVDKKVNETIPAYSVEKKMYPETTERKPFVTLAEKKQGFSPMVRKVPSISVEKSLDSESANVDVPKSDIEKEKVETKEEVKKVTDMIVVHKESPVKNDIVLGRKVEVTEEEERDEKTMDEEDVNDDKDGSASDSQSVKKKVRKKTKKKLEAEDQDGAKKASNKVRGPSARIKENQKKAKDNSLNKEKESESVVKETVPDIDLRCEEHIRSRSASPETVTVPEKPSVQEDSEGFAPLIEAMECRLKESQQSSNSLAMKEDSNVSVKSNVYENTPPTTPEHDSDESNQQNSHSEQIKNAGKALSELSSKIVDSSQPVGNESPQGNASPSNRSTGSSSGVVAGSEGSDVPVVSNKRRRESDEATPTKRRKRASRGKSAATRARQMAESDSEEASNQCSTKGRSPYHTSESYPSRSSTNSRNSPRPSKYNFNLEEGKYLEGTARITFLVSKIQEIRKIYMNLKSEVACIDRRRKRLRKRQIDHHASSSSAVEVEMS